jgi:DNA-binding CsgD family transcriptional regulator
MHLKQKTVETYREKIKRKLELSNGNQLIQRASRWVLEQEPV